MNAEGAKFCVECGAGFGRRCPSCDTPYESGRFCAECGASLLPETAAAPAPPLVGPEAERRLVSVLFADLVGFTTLSEDRDAEDVRELLTRYFDTARQVIGRYGGIVEKFIGDAVMAVWGAPVAREDDAELAVRAAIDLLDAVAALGPGLRVRAGIVTGEAAVTLGAEGQGLVAGDLVNTASRVQSVARPGTVLVGEATRRATDAAIAYEDAGEHELKGKAEPARLWRALRVVAGRGGEIRATGLEAPFVGRAAELRLVKELFHATAEERRARLVSVIGIAGIGKSRLAWEFAKYVDGLVDLVGWHRGRCLAYGEGIAFWALAEMVRARAGIVEEEPAAAALTKLHDVVARFVPDLEERTWIEPRLQHLLGLTERVASDQQDLFSAWRRFFERIAEVSPIVLLFEDLHWADAGLLDFVEYLLDWSRNHPIFLLTLARPELMERRPTWGAGTRSFNSIFLEPLAPSARDELLQGLAPGLPDEIRALIGERAEGVPLYAIETVRMLLDRGLLTRENGQYLVTGQIDALDVPETLHALIAARLDGLEPAERRLLENGAVLGKTFTPRALAAVSELDEGAVGSMLGSLVRKEILAVQADPLSPERGQYEFMHALVQKVAYDTLSRSERKARHLRVAAYLEAEWGPDDPEIVEVVASHYLEAYRAAPDAPDAPEIEALARDRLTRAGDRAASLAASEDAQRYFEQAADLSDDPLVEAELCERAGEMARAGGRIEEAGSLFERSIALFEGEGKARPAARVVARLADTLQTRGQPAAAIEHMERSLEDLMDGQRDADLAAIAAELARLQFFMGDVEQAFERIELALEIAEPLGRPDIVSQALITKGLILTRRPEEALALVQHGLVMALEHDVPPVALRAYFNLMEIVLRRSRYDQALALADKGLALARRRGDRFWEWHIQAQMAEPLSETGRWDEALAIADEVGENVSAESADFISIALLPPLVRIHTARGDRERARSLVSAPFAADLQDTTILMLGRAIADRAEGRHHDVLADTDAILQGRRVVGANLLVDGIVEGVESALAIGDVAAARRLLHEIDGLPAFDLSQYPMAQVTRLRARLAAATGETEAVGPGLTAAVAGFREVGASFWLAVALLEHGEWLSAEGREEDARPLLAEAREIFERLRAVPWLERADAAAASRTMAV